MSTYFPDATERGQSNPARQILNLEEFGWYC